MMHHQALEYVYPFTLTVGCEFFTQSSSSRLFLMATWEVGNRIYEKYAIYSFIKHHLQHITKERVFNAIDITPGLMLNKVEISFFVVKLDQLFF